MKLNTNLKGALLGLGLSLSACDPSALPKEWTLDFRTRIKGACLAGESGDPTAGTRTNGQVTSVCTDTNGDNRVDFVETTIPLVGGHRCFQPTREVDCD